MRPVRNPKTRSARRHRRHVRVRQKVQGTAERPRLVVRRSLRFMYAQIIDDVNGVTLAAASDRLPGFTVEKGKSRKIGAAYSVGKQLAAQAREKGVEHVVFDRGGYIYHGRVKALADGARAGGLEF
ncbi:MAG: 50S ribosomal protein L18 [Gemmatimonadales bacterium]